MSHDIADQLRAILAQVDGNSAVQFNPIRVDDVTNEYRRTILPKYRHNDSQYRRLVFLLDLLDDEFCDQPADTFGPKRLRQIRDMMVKSGNSRRYVNDRIADIVRIFTHAVSVEMIGPERIVALKTLKPLRHGEAREPEPRRKPTIDEVRQTCQYLKPMVRDMVRLQVGAAMRPGEVFKIRPTDIDQTSPEWIYRPKHHKTAHHGKPKAIPIVGDARAAIRDWMGDPDDLCFRTARGNPWNRNSYRLAIHRACEAAGVPKWTGYDLRHLAAQSVRDALGPEYAQAILGHSRISMVETYAKASEAKAIKAARVAPNIGTAQA